jgi:hypothetical protein
MRESMKTYLDCLPGLIDFFHSSYFPQAGDRMTGLGEIRRVMKPPAKRDMFLLLPIN